VGDRGSLQDNSGQKSLKKKLGRLVGKEKFGSWGLLGLSPKNVSDGGVASWAENRRHVGLPRQEMQELLAVPPKLLGVRRHNLKKSVTERESFLFWVSRISSGNRQCDQSKRKACGGGPPGGGS